MNTFSQRQDVIAEGRRWLRTPFVHQARVRGVGVDCLNLIWAVGVGASAMAPIAERAAAPFWQFYGRRPNAPKMRECLAKFLVPIADGEQGTGDIAWMHWGNQIPIHMAILSSMDDRPTLIHAVWEVGVVEHGLTADIAANVFSWWRYPIIAETAKLQA